MLEIPVSIGEAVDKLTILDIKLEMIKDPQKLIDVNKERDLIKTRIPDDIDDRLYTIMKEVNLDIWKMMDKLRDGDLSDEDYLTECRNCIVFNDVRFRIKKLINEGSKSELKEQKGYKVTRLLVKTHMDDNQLLRASLFYDETVVMSDEEKTMYNIRFTNEKQDETMFNMVI
jgi:hypothetical protein